MIGSEACAKCHQEQFATYLLTMHSRSFSVVDPQQEPADGTFVHEPSGRTFEVYREGDQVWHRDSLIDNGETLATTAHPLKYLVGSGKHSRTYLVDVDGFLFESPVTWYESRKRWSLSPGYEVAIPPSFERAADFGCVVCHVGQAERIDESLHRLSFRELAIGCERCHGPGRDHAALAETLDPGSPPPGAVTHPARLDREVSEDICAQCHLRGEATVFHPGQGPETFHPGQSLSSNRLDFFVAASRETMNVVGHVEQMRMSRCYTQTETFTCTTCHKLHAPEPEDRVAFFREKCLECHTSRSCGLAEDSSERATTADNCVACHMPRGDTDIPHIAFTHHRIGIHKQGAKPKEPSAFAGLPPLRSHQSTEGIPSVVVNRALGLAYLEIAPSRSTASEFAACRQEAIGKLLDYDRVHPGDGVVEAALAQLLLDYDPQGSGVYAEKALAKSGLPGQSRVNALLVKSLVLLDGGAEGRAAAVLDELGKARLSPLDAPMRSSVLFKTDLNKALMIADQAIRVRPLDPDLIELRATILQRLGRKDEAAMEQERLAKLRRRQATR